MSKVITVQDGNLVFNMSFSEADVDINLVDGNINLGADGNFAGAINLGTRVQIDESSGIFRVLGPSQIDILSIAESGTATTFTTNNNDMLFDSGGGSIEFRSSTILKLMDAGNTSWLQMGTSGTNTTFAGIGSVATLSLQLSGGLRIVDTIGATDWVTFRHTGTDFDITGFQTADINITGITAINAGTVDADFDNLTATDFNGVALTTAGVATNYLDETGSYSIPPAAFSAPLSLIGDINTATPPLAEAITALLNFVDLAQNDTIGSLGFTAANDLVLSNLMHDGNLSLITVDVAAGDAGDILFTTGDGNAASDAGGDIILQVGQGSGTGASGNVFINTTTGVGFQGGSVQVTEGAGIVSMYGVGSTGNGATAGDVEIWGGYAANGDDTSTAGEVNIFGGGAGGGPTVGGNVCLMGGESDGEPGSVVLIGGSATTGGTGGTVKLTGGPGAGSANQFGGRVIIDGGLGVGTGNGGQVEITAGESGSGVTGNGGNLILEGADSNATVGFGGDVLMTGGISRGTLAGGAVIITGGASGFSATGVGGPVTITGGASLSTNDDGGTASFISGAGNGTGAGGLLSITGGASGAGATGAGGAISITGGVALSTNDDGGNVTITGGAGNGSGVDGTILLSVGSFERLEAQAGGTVAIRSDGNTDSTDDRLLSFQHQDGTVRATIGHETGGNSVLWIRNLIATGIVRLTAQDTGDVTRTILLGDPDGLTILRGETHVQINVNEFDNAIYAQAGLDVALFYNNTYRLRTAPNGINVRSLSDTDVGQRTISFEHQDGTVRAVIGHEGDDVFVIRNDITGGDLDIVSGDATIAATSGGSVNITSGVGNTTGTGGDITILGGDSGAGASGGGGTITITGGDAVSTNGPGGFLYLQTGESNGAAFAPWITSSIGTVDADRMTAGEVQTTTASTTTILEVTVGSGSGFGFEIHVMGTQDATGDTVFERIFGAVRNQGGTTALVGTNIVSRTDDAGASTWVIDVTGDDTLDELLIEVTGEGSHTIDWKVKIHMLDV